MKPNLDAIRARCEAATPGPWHAAIPACDHEHEPDEDAASIEGPDGCVIGDCVEREGDIQFIAHARTDIPALLAYIDDLEHERDGWKFNACDARDRIAMLEHMLEEERQNVDMLRAAVEDAHPAFASCNRARQHCELECEDLRKRIAELDAARECLPPVNEEHEAIVDRMLAEAREGVTKRPIVTHSPGETEWSSRIAHAEARFVEEYDMRKSAEQQVEELRARIVTLEAMKP